MGRAEDRVARSAWRPEAPSRSHRLASRGLWEPRPPGDWKWAMRLRHDVEQAHRRQLG